MKKKSILTVAMAAILAGAMMLSGCGNDAGTSSEAGGDSTPESSVQESTGGEREHRRRGEFR